MRITILHLHLHRVIGVSVRVPHERGLLGGSNLPLDSRTLGQEINESRI